MAAAFVRCEFRLVAALLMAVTAGAGARAEEGKAYTLEECVRFGLANSAVATKARLDQQIAETVVRQARAEALPQVSVSANYTRLDEVQEIDFGEETIEAGALDNYQAQADVSQLLYSGGRVKAALKAANLTRRHADWAKLNDEETLVRDIRVGFFDILFARAALRVRQESVALLRAQTEQIERKYRSGAVSEFDAVSARVRLANELPALINVSNGVDVATENFRRLLDVSDAHFDIRGELACEPLSLSLEDAERLAMVNRPAIRQVDYVVRLREQDVAATASRARPSLRARFSYAGSNPPYGLVTFVDEWQWHWNAGLVATWNVWDGDLTRAAVRQKELELAKSQTDLDEIRKAVRLEVKTAYLDMRRALEAVQAGKDTVQMAEKGLAIARSRYDSGLSTFLEFTDSNLALSTARLLHHQALRDHMAAVAQLQYACGAGKVAAGGGNTDHESK